MACSDVKLACCRLCGKTIASDRGECIHCGVCKPVKDDKCSWLHWILLGSLIAGTVMATLRYEAVRHIVPDCPIQEIHRPGGC